MTWLLYNVMFGIGFVLLLPRFVYRMLRRGGYAPHFAERLARYRPEVRARLAEGGRIWIQAVSVGELLVAFRFIERWRARLPNLRFVVSTTTSTGRALAERQIAPQDVLIYFPLDFPRVVRRALDCIRPAALVLVECELWPNLVRLARQRGIPVVLVNGRISDHSFQNYCRVKYFTRRLLPMVDLFCVQSRLDAERLVALGAPPDRVVVMGSAKYDVAQPDAEGEARARAVCEAAGVPPTARILLGGSTWPGEEAALARAYQELRNDFPDVFLVLAPRHVERSRSVLRELSALGLSVRRRSESGLGTSAPRPDVLLVDTTGELRSFYALATVIFVGKSLTRRGGQNVIEPALYAKPIVVGPHMENFRAVVEDFLAAGALVQVRDAAELKAALRELLGDERRRHALGARSAEVVRRKRGAVEATLARLETLPNLARRAASAGGPAD